MADEWTQEEINKLAEEDSPDFVEISEKEAMEEVNQARRRIDFKKRQQEVVAQMKQHHDNPAKLWQLSYDWLMESNPEARKGIQSIIEECNQIRQTRANTYARGNDINIRYGMRIPEIVLDAISLVDPRIREMELMDKEQAVKLYREE